MSPKNASSADDGKDAGETVQFLSNKALDPEVQIVSQTREGEEASPESPRRRCCACCSLKCGLISAVVAILAVLLVLAAGYYRYASKLTGTATSADSKLWEEKLYSDTGEVRPQRELSGM